MFNTIIQYLGIERENNLFIKREDLIPYSFGGNKARKAEYFFNEIDSGKYDYVVTYGSSSSNHCRIISNLASARGIGCKIISPFESSELTFNSKMMELFGADIIVVPIKQVHDTIEEVLQNFKTKGYKPYFIAGGGHGKLGTQSYVDCYDEVCKYEMNYNIHFDYIFHASGTGTTQAGLICGQLLHMDHRHIVGISIARKNPRGREIVIDSIKEYLGNKKAIEEATVFIDSYIGEGYNSSNNEIKQIILYVLNKYGIPLDITYTGKAFYGMLDYLTLNQVKNKNILFIHTGGTPLFFDFLKGC